MSDPDRRRRKIRRRLVTVPALFAATAISTLTLPVWFPASVLYDALRLHRRLPTTRLASFGLLWCWIESGGVVHSFRLWMIGRASDHDAEYALMGWWAGHLMTALRWTIGVRPHLDGAALEGGNAVVLSRHASLADSLLSGWAMQTMMGLHPRYVLKRELLYDPCLDIVGLRVPNHFLDRGTADSDRELQSLRELAEGVGPGVVAVIFTEGTRSNDQKRIRAIEKIAERDPGRARRLGGLRHLLPPRPAGSIALVEGAPGADVVFAWHTGFDGLDSFGGMLRTLRRPLPQVRFVTRRVQRSDVPSGEALGDWLDLQWLRMDAEVEAALTTSS
ncbi:MAG: lysophospholipid acyltransferase family protein [Ilumatobacteraceae bacterium]